MKKCPRCQETKELEAFAKNRRKKDGRQGECRSCKAARDRTYYARDPDAHKARVKRWEKQVKGQVLEFLKEHPCVDCGEADPLLLEFDHLDNKSYNVSEGYQSKGYSWKRLQEEIAKCEVRCVYCHRRRTARTRGWSMYGYAPDS